MRILFIENNLAGGGAEKVLLTLLEYLKPPQYDITLLLIKNKGVYINDIPPYVKLQYMIDVNNNDIPFSHNPSDLTQFYEENINNDYDIEIAFLEGPPTKLLAYSSNINSTKIAWVHTDLENVHWTYPYYNSLEEECNCYKKMDKIIFVSENAKKRFEHLFGMCFPKSIVINNPIDSLKIQSLAKEFSVYYDGFTCVVVGSLVNRKGHSRLIYSMGRLFQMGYRFHLYIIGNGSEEASLKELCHILTISEYVHFMGFQKNPYPYVANADLLISSSISEGYPLVSCEALSLSVPILATDCTGNKDVLQNGKYGLLVDNTEEGIFSGLKSVLDSSELYKQLKEKSIAGLNECKFQIRLEQIKKLLWEDSNV